MTLENVTLEVNGQRLSTFERMEVSAGIKDACRSMSAVFPDVAGAPAVGPMFFGSPEVKVFATGDLLFAGYVDRVSPHLNGKMYQVEICARSKGQDAVHSSVDHTKPDYVNRNVLDVAKDQDRFGIGFSCDVQLDGFDRYRPNPGASLFHSLKTLCEDEGCTMCGQPDGSVTITRAGETAQAHAGYLAEGMNLPGGLWIGRASFDTSAQHSKVTSHGQTFAGTGSQATQINASATNSEIGRDRPFVEHHDRQTSRDRLKKRATRRRDREQGEGIRAEIRVRGWRDMGGALWTPGWTIFVVSPSLFLAQTMLIETALFAQGGHESEGTMTTLHLVDPRAHGGKGGKGIDRSGAAWGFDSSAGT